MRLKIITITVATLALALAGAVHAAQTDYRYKWLDTHGQSHYSDSLTQDAIKNGYEVINSQGIVVRHVERELTPSERAARKARQEQADAAARLAEQRKANDQQILAAYPTAADFKSAQQARIDAITDHIHTTEINLRSQEKSLAELLNQAADAERANKSIPKFLTDRIATQRKAVAEQQAQLQRQHAKQAATQKQARESLQRYQTLRAQQQAQSIDGS